MLRRRFVALAFGLTAAASLALGQTTSTSTAPPAPPRKPASPSGTAATQVGGSWSAPDKDGEQRYQGGKWIEITYSRPILKGRSDVFGSGADYGKKVNSGAPLWRAGANQTTRLKTEVPLEIGGKRIAPGEYSLFVDLKEAGWTLVISTQPIQEKYDPKEKMATWGAYNYDPKYDVARAPMKVEKASHSLEEFMIDFVDVTSQDGKLAMWWDKEFATADFKIVN